MRQTPGLSTAGAPVSIWRYLPTVAPRASVEGIGETPDRRGRLEAGPDLMAGSTLLG
jgi:hypothetical protein